MQIGVYGSGYLATVISACLADFGTPVCCCHADGTSIMEVAKGNIPFFEKNLQEVIRRNVRSGRLVYSADPEELARKAQVIFLAEDSAQGLEELVAPPGERGGPIPGAVDRDPGPGGFDHKDRQNPERKRAEEPAGVPADVLSPTAARWRTSTGPTALFSGRLRAKRFPR